MTSDGSSLCDALGLRGVRSFDRESSASLLYFVLGSQSLELGGLGDVAEHIDELLLAAVVELTAHASEVFFDLTTLVVESVPIIQ